jgi:hypothetical protein
VFYLKMGAEGELMVMLYRLTDDEGGKPPYKILAKELASRGLSVYSTKFTECRN